jgi:hypothetical protein
LQRIAGLASIPERVSGLEQTIDSLLPQVDKIGVCLNNYLDFPNFLVDEKIEVIKSNNSRGDAGKFLFTKPESIYFSCDDDILYPPDYVEESIKHLESGVVVSHHGRILLNTPVKSSLRDECVSFSCLKEVQNTHIVHLGGTGVMCFFTEDLPIHADNLRFSNMADEQVARLVVEHNLKVIIPPHEEGWIKENRAGGGINLYELKVDDCQVETIFINSVEWPKITLPL